MCERKGVKISKADFEAVDQMIWARIRFKDTAPMIGNTELGKTMRVVNESLFAFGNETEPYTEKDINAMMFEIWGTSSKQNNVFLRRSSSAR